MVRRVRGRTEMDKRREGTGGRSGDDNHSRSRLREQVVQVQRGELTIVRGHGCGGVVSALFAEGHGHFLCGEVVHRSVQVAGLNDGDDVAHGVLDGDVAVPLAELRSEGLSNKQTQKAHITQRSVTTRRTAGKHDTTEPQNHTKAQDPKQTEQRKLSKHQRPNKGRRTEKKK